MSKKNKNKIDYGMTRPHKTTRKGVKPNEKKKPVKGSYRGHPSKYYDEVNKVWNQPK